MASGERSGEQSAHATVASPAEPAAGSSEVRDRDDPFIGRVLNGRVRIVRAIARGGMGKVYFGEQIALGRPCAIKILDPRLHAEGDAFVKRFLLEASTASKLTHPNAVTIYDYGQTDDGTCFIAMEYLDGRTLATEIKEHPRLPAARVVGIARQVCRALREAHELGVVHRDMKPGNVFLVKHDDEGDFIKVLDFGLVKDSHPSGDSDLTQVGQIMGSPKYMAPEQVQGRAIDARADIYSVGAMLFTMLTGHAPFERATPMATMMAHVGEPVPAFSAVASDLAIAESIEALVRKCLEKSPENRFGSMEELLLALKAFDNQAAVLSVTRSGVYVTTNDAPPAAVAAPLARRSKAVGIALGAAAGVVLLVASLRGGATPAANSGAVASTGSEAIGRAVVEPTAAPAPIETPKLVTKMVHFTSEPPGARVREDGLELCLATPCDVTFSGDSADPATEHLLTFTKADYKTENKIVRASAPLLHVKLSKTSSR